MIKNKILFLFIVILISFANIIYPQDKVLFFYFQDNFLVIYKDDNNKIFIDKNSGFVIKPEEQEKKLKLVEYILNTQTFISRDEDIFTKLYLFKKAINFDFENVDPSNIDYYSWGPLVYKHLAIFCKNINESITITIPSFEQLPEKIQKDIIERYRLSFGTSFNEPRYLTYSITLKKVQNEVQNKNTTIYTTKENNQSLNNTSENISQLQNTSQVTLQTTSQVTLQTTSSKSYQKDLLLFIYQNKLLIGSIIIILILFFTTVAFSFLKKALKKSQKLYNENTLGFSNERGFQNEENMINKDVLKNEVFQEIKNSFSETIDEINKKIENLEKVLIDTTQKIEELKNKLENISKKDNLLEMGKENIEDIHIDQTNENKVLDKESLEMSMFLIDNIINKLRNIEIYKELDINSKTTKIITELMNLKNQIRQTKSLNMLQWDNLIKTKIIDLLTTLDTYIKIYSYNDNIYKTRKDIMNTCQIEEIYIVPKETRVNIIDHRVEGYSRDPQIPNGIITEVKEIGYKYKGITVKRAKVIENRI